MSSIDPDALTTLSKCNKCGYCHPLFKYPAYGKECYSCGGHNDYTAKETEDPSGPPATADPDHSDNQADQPRKRADQGQAVIILTAGTGPATPPMDTLTIPPAKAPPTALPLDVPVGPQEGNGCPPPIDTIRIVSK